MAASELTVLRVAHIIEDYVPDENIRPMMDELLKVEGNKSFTATMASLDVQLRKHGIGDDD